MWAAEETDFGGNLGHITLWLQLWFCRGQVKILQDYGCRAREFDFG